MRVDGLFRGRIYTEELLEVGEEGRIEGDLDAQNLVIAGFVDGRVRVRGRLVVEATGRVQGEVRASRLVVREGAKLDAQVISGE